MENLKKFKGYVKDVLIGMAIDCSLPMDMTELNMDEVFDIAEASINAEDYLYDGEVSVAEQVRRIIAEYHNIPARMIDHIDGVTPIERFEYCFTARDFLTHIRYLK